MNALELKEGIDLRHGLASQFPNAGEFLERQLVSPADDSQWSLSPDLNTLDHGPSQVRLE